MDTLFAMDLRIGDRVNFSPVPPSADPETVRELHELCITRNTPHVHIVTNHATICKGFRTPVGRRA